MDGLLKRFLKFSLKRSLGKYLDSDIDLEQLDVKLGSGKLELRNLLLRAEAINQELAEVTRRWFEEQLELVPPGSKAHLHAVQKQLAGIGCRAHCQVHQSYTWDCVSAAATNKHARHLNLSTTPSVHSGHLQCPGYVPLA